MVFIVVFIPPATVIIHRTAFTGENEIQSAVGIIVNAGIKGLLSKNYFAAIFHILI